MRLFVYGTLMCADVTQALLRKTFAGETAVLPNHRRRQMRGQHYPAVEPALNEWVEGLLYENINASQWRILDAFEGEFYRRVPASVKLFDDTAVTAQVYVLKPRYRKLLGPCDWQLAEFEERHKTVLLRRCGV